MQNKALVGYGFLNCKQLGSICLDCQQSIFLFYLFGHDHRLGVPC